MILLKNARIINKGSVHHDTVKDIMIENGVITQIDTSITAENVQILEFDNLHVSIGWIDSSVSMGSPGYEERQSIDNGIKAAAASGFTSIILNANNNPNPENASGIRSLKSQYENPIVNFYPVGSLTLDQKGAHLAELYDMKEAGAVSFYDYKKSVQNANLLKVALQYSTGFNGIIQSYPEQKDISGKGIVNEDENTVHLGLKSQPALAESLQVARDIELSRYTNAPLHFPTLSTVESLELIAAAKAKGIPVSCSVSVHHLSLTSAQLSTFDSRYKLQPPLRDQDTIKSLKTFAMDGTIDTITSDHIPLNIEHKDVEFNQATPGSIGLESSFCMANKVLGCEKTVELMTSSYDLFDINKPVLSTNKKAALTLFNPAPTYTFQEKNIISTSKNSAALNQEVQGVVYGIINGTSIQLN